MTMMFYNYDEITIIFFRLKFTIFLKFIKNKKKELMLTSFSCPSQEIRLDDS